MKVQFNTDKTVHGDQRSEAFFTTQIKEELQRFQSEITRIEVHVSDENGQKKGSNDIRCLIEARIEGKQPIAVICQTDTIEQSISGALDKLKTSLDKRN